MLSLGTQRCKQGRINTNEQWLQTSDLLQADDKEVLEADYAGNIKSVINNLLSIVRCRDSISLPRELLKDVQDVKK